MFRKISILLILSISTLLANSGEHSGGSDIIERTFNFVVFASLVYYLVAEPLKNFLNNRTNSIENEFKKIDANLQDSKDALENAKLQVANVENNSKTIISDAKKEADLISNKIKSNLETELAILEKQHSELVELEKTKMVKIVVDEVLQEILKGDNGLDQDSLTKTLLKKVS
jgi:F-type H+-transporting ATPase subunit b